MSAIGLTRLLVADSAAVVWGLDEASGTTAADVSGNGRNGTIAGSGTLRGARFGDLQFWQGDASTGHITCTIPALSVADMTFEALVYIPSSSQKGHFFGLVDSVANAAKGYSFGVGAANDNGTNGNIGNGLSEAVAWGSLINPLGTGLMHIALKHVAGTPVNQTIYKNGVQAATGTITGGNFTGATTFFAGGNTSSSLNRHTGCALGYVAAIFNATWSPAQILAHAQLALRLAQVGG